MRYSAALAAQMKKHETFESWVKACCPNPPDNAQDIYEQAHGRKRGPGRPKAEDDEPGEAEDSTQSD